MKKLLPKTKMFLKRHSPTILTCVGAAGVVATAIFAVKATPKAMELIKFKESEKGDKLTVLETVRIAGPAYIPSAIIGASTIACIFGANALNKKQQASLLSAYALLDSSYKEYIQATKNIFGEEGDKRIVEKIASSRKEGLTEEEVLIYDDNMVCFYKAKLDDIKKAETKINNIFRKRGYACLQEFYDCLGGKILLDPNYEYGWNYLDGQYLYDTDHISINVDLVTNDDGTKFYVLTMPFKPKTEYLL